MPNPNTRLSGLLERNVAAVAKLEATLLGERSRGAQVIRWVVRRVGTPVSAVLHVVLFGGWVLWNAGGAPPGLRCEAAPFPILELIVSGEAILLGILILASQNRLQEEEDQRSHLALQVSLLNEAETTRMIHMLDHVCKHFGIESASGEEIDELKLDTDPEEIVETLRSTIPSDQR